MTFEPREEALGAWQEVKGEAMSVNEALIQLANREGAWP